MTTPIINPSQNLPENQENLHSSQTDTSAQTSIKAKDIFILTFFITTTTQIWS